MMKNKKKTFKIEIDIEKFTGKLARVQYLEENPDGYRRVRKVHKNKKKYSRKNKHKGRKPLFLCTFLKNANNAHSLT